MLILGCGYVGQELALRALTSGYQVTAVRRDIRKLAEPIPGISADLVLGTGLESISGRFDFIVYALSAGSHDLLAYENAYVRGLSNALSFLREREQTPERVVFVSSTGVYAQNAGEWVDENSITEPENFSGRTVLAGERLLLESGFPALVVRFGGIYGPERTLYLRQVLEGKARELRNEQHFTNRIHRDDCASSILHLLSTKVEQPIVIGCDNEPCTRTEVLRWLAERLRKNLPVEGDPEELLTSGKRCRNELLRKSGYTFLYPSFREGYGSLLPADCS